eukprot:TRINITY_DN21902_c0_g1_i1.p1 TRINITY_DN21902_c0_g1~~TRINITY_DN21902_c0_g1_i1.p1  ORF type:complete len:194 (+),score=25.52 TRINITY_DN21902_c0_g1_i1:43-624(+)
MKGIPVAVVVVLLLAVQCSASCFEAFVLDYPKCRDYEGNGYVCRGGWCVSGECIGDCTLCAVERVGFTPDFTTVRCVDSKGDAARSNAEVYVPAVVGVISVVAALYLAVKTGLLLLPMLLVASYLTAGTSLAYTSTPLFSLACIYMGAKLFFGSLGILRMLTFLLLGVAIGLIGFIYLERTFPIITGGLRLWF